MLTIAITAQELGMTPYDLSSFLDLGPGVDPDAEITEDYHREIHEMVTYDLKHNTPAEHYKD